MKYFAVIDTNVIVSAMLKNDSEKPFVVTPAEMMEIINRK